MSNNYLLLQEVVGQLHRVQFSNLGGPPSGELVGFRTEEVIGRAEDYRR